ncbi:MAG TPA: hypothetical protein VF158_00035 [Longimicrobiales bacterium]
MRQIVPARLGERSDGRDPARAARVGAVSLEMEKIGIVALEAAYRG